MTCFHPAKAGPSGIPGAAALFIIDGIGDGPLVTCHQVSPSWGSEGLGGALELGQAYFGLGRLEPG